MYDFDAIIRASSDIGGPEKLAKALVAVLAHPDRCSRLTRAFLWRAAPQGDDYWEQVFDRGAIHRPEDIEFLNGLLAAALKMCQTRAKAPRMLPGSVRAFISLALLVGPEGASSPPDSIEEIAKASAQILKEQATQHPEIKAAFNRAGLSWSETIGRLERGRRMSVAAHARLSKLAGGRRET